MKLEKKIQIAQKKLTALQAMLARSLARKNASDKNIVTNLAKKLGYKNAEAMFAELFGAKSKVAGKGASSVAPKVRKNAKVTDAIRQAIISDVKGEKGTAAVIAKRHGVSVPTVNNIKKAANLTNLGAKAKAKALAEAKAPRKGKAKGKVKRATKEVEVKVKGDVPKTEVAPVEPPKPA